MKTLTISAVEGERAPIEPEIEHFIVGGSHGLKRFW